jgi:hypothetical protein
MKIGGEYSSEKVMPGNFELLERGGTLLATRATPCARTGRYGDLRSRHDGYP